jgi:hypothetical protein
VQMVGAESIKLLNLAQSDDSPRDCLVLG